MALQLDHQIVHLGVGAAPVPPHHLLPQHQRVAVVGRPGKLLERIAEELHPGIAALISHDLEESHGVQNAAGGLEEGVEEGVIGGDIGGIPAEQGEHFVEHPAGIGGVAHGLPPLEENCVGVGVGADHLPGAGEEVGCLAGEVAADGGEEGIEGDDVAGPAVLVHEVEGDEGLVDAAGGGVGGEDGGEGGEGEDALGAHGFDGVPHGVEEVVLAEEVDDEVPGVGGVVVDEVEAGPSEELDGGGGGGVGELEDLLDVGGGGADAGGGEGGFEGGGGGGGRGGEDFAEESDLVG